MRSDIEIYGGSWGICALRRNVNKRPPNMDPALHWFPRAEVQRSFWVETASLSLAYVGHDGAAECLIF